MSFNDLLNAIQAYRQQINDSRTITELVNDAFGDWLVAQGIGRTILIDESKLLMNVNGHLKTEPSPIRGVRLHERFIVLNLDEFNGLTESLEGIIGNYTLEGDGAYVWIIPDGYMAALTVAEQKWEADGGGYFSHESICVSNTADIDTRCVLTVLYQDVTKENLTCDFDVPAHRSVHYRLDKLKDATGQPLIVKDAAVSYKLTSLDARVVVQGSRILTSGEGSEFASFGTVMAWCPQ